MAGCVDLITLDARANRLSHLPHWIAGLPHLRKLDVRWNTPRLDAAWIPDLTARGVLVYR
jgi:hypothetical protein